MPNYEVSLLRWSRATRSSSTLDVDDHSSRVEATSSRGCKRSRMRQCALYIADDGDDGWNDETDHDNDADDAADDRDADDDDR